MTQARSKQVSLQDTRYYHLISRCVRRAYLCGEDSHTKQSFEHRRQWMVDRIRFLTTVFAIDVAAYAVMSNHYHLVVYIDESEALAWSEEEVCQRWQQLYHLHPLVERLQKGQSSCQAERDKAHNIINEWRSRLSDLSWLMRNLNEHIARKANAEDNCKGRFWEGRFKSQALLDGKAVLACMAYVDLNPLRAKMAATPEDSKHTSIQRRIHALQQEDEQPKSLAPFVGNPRQPMPDGLPLVDWTGRQLRDDKRGAISSQLPPILDRLAIEPKQWLILTSQFESRFSVWIGAAQKLKAIAQQLGYQRTPGLRQCQALL